MAYEYKNLLVTVENHVGTLLINRPEMRNALNEETMDEMRAALKEYLIQSQEEGSVLLRNEGNALPLAADASVTLFGFAAATPVYHGGSGGPPNTGINLYDALKEAGVGAMCLQRAETDFALNSLKNNQANGRIRSTGIFLYENGNVGTMQQLDLAQ